MRSEWDIVNRGALGQETISGNKYNKFSVLISKAWNFFPPQADIREEDIIWIFQKQPRVNSWHTLYERWEDTWYRLQRYLTVQIRLTLTDSTHQPATSSWLALKKWWKQPYRADAFSRSDGASRELRKYIWSEKRKCNNLLASQGWRIHSRKDKESWNSCFQTLKHLKKTLSIRMKGIIPKYWNSKC